MRVEHRPGLRVIFLCVLSFCIASNAAKPALATGQDTTGDCLVLRFEGHWNPNHAAAIAVDLHTAYARRRVQLCPIGVESTGRILVLSAAASTLESVTLSLDTEQGETLTRRISLEQVPTDGRVFAIVIAGDELLRASKQQPDLEARATRASAAPPSASPEPSGPVASRVSARERAARLHANAVSLALGTELYAAGQAHLGPNLEWQHTIEPKLFTAVTLLGRRGFSVDTAAGVVETKLLGTRAALGYTVFARRGLSLSLDAGARLGRIWFDATAHGTSRSRSSSGWLAYADALAAVKVHTRSALAAQFAVGLGLPLLSQAAVDGRSTITGAAGLAAQAHTALVLAF